MKTMVDKEGPWVEVQAPVGNTEISHFKSPKRMLVRFFRQSRDRWKRKCKELRADLKRVRVRMYDLNESQQHWKHRAQQRLKEQEQLQAQLGELKGQLAQAQEALKKTGH